MYYLCIGLVILRFIWVILPQQGYIHPDEFFQSVEIVAGDILDVDHFRSWEFLQPFRSILPPYLIAGIPFLTIHKLQLIFPWLKSAYWILTPPRIVMFMTSLSIDGATFIIAKDLKIRPGLALILASSSYVTIVYATHTLTNSLETFFFCILLVLVIRLIKYQVHFQRLVGSNSQKDKASSREDVSRKRKKNDISDSDENLDKNSLIHKENEHEMKKDMKNISMKLKENLLSLDADLSRKELTCIFFLGVVCVGGFFTRPTFLVFSIMPLLAWDAYYKYISSTKPNLILFLALSLTTIIFVSVDALYFYSDMFLECLTKNNFSSCLYFTLSVSISPYNFITYNSDSSNLVHHGIHPRYLHLLVNTPLLFGPATIFIFISLIKLFKCLYSERFSTLWQAGCSIDRNVSANLVLLFFVPVSVLSVFPHQEPRFLLPLLPLVVLITTKHLSGLSPAHKTLFMFSWFTFNAILSILYGVAHQGGVIPSLTFLQREIRKNNSNFTTNDRFVFFHTYMPPQHLLLSDPSKPQITDLKGSSTDRLESEIHRITKEIQRSQEVPGNVYVLLPGTLIYNLHIKYESVKEFRFHLSTEDMPSLNRVMDVYHKGSLEEALHILVRDLSLHLIQVKK